MPWAPESRGLGRTSGSEKAKVDAKIQELETYIDQYYLACEHNGTDPCIHIMKKGGVEPNLLRDVAVYTYRPDDFDPKTDPTGAFRRRFALATAGEEIIPRKRYYLPYKKIETILI